jgi:hypothetical protein
MISFGEPTKLFTEKLVTMLILKSFSVIQKEHLSIRQNTLNYLSGLIAHKGSQQAIRGEFLIKVLEMQFRYFKKQDFTDNKVFNHSFYQALAY